MSDKLIDYEDIMQTIRNNFAEVMDEDENYYYGYNVQITDEQQFLRIKEAQHDTIFMVVKFGASTTFYGASVVPITISAISENNHCFICQRLLTDYAQKFNLADYGKDSVQQIYETPSVSLNFNEVYSGFRSVLTLSGTFVIAKNISFYNFIYNYKDEKGNATSVPGWNPVAATDAPENFVVLDQVKTASGSAAVKKDVVNYSLTVATPDMVFGDVTVGFGAAVGNDKEAANLGLSAKAGYANDQLSASVASDLVIAGIGNDEVAFDADVAAKFSFAPVTVDAYYATKASTANKLLDPKSNAAAENLLSVKVAADLSSFDVPVKVSAYAKDIVNAQVLGVSASATVDALEVGASFDYGIEEEAYLLGATVSYKFDAFTVAAGINYNSTEQLYANASVETASIIPGATLKLAYGPVSKDGKVTTNLLDEKYGKIDATCTIAF